MSIFRSSKIRIKFSKYWKAEFHLSSTNIIPVAYACKTPARRPNMVCVVSQPKHGIVNVQAFRVTL